MNTALRVRELRSGYGVLEVVRSLDLHVNEGDFLVILGMNGAGKTTLLSVLMGLVKPWSGSIQLHGVDVTGLGPRRRVRMGMSLVPEGRHLFADLSVELNLRLGGWGARRTRADIGERLEHVYAQFPKLAQRRSQLAGRLSGGEQQMVAIGRALVAKPRLLLVDECSLGLAPVVVNEVFESLSRLCDEGITVLAVEQTPGILQYANRALILDRGEFIYQGDAAELRQSRELLQAAYLGAVHQ